MTPTPNVADFFNSGFLTMGVLLSAIATIVLGKLLLRLTRQPPTPLTDMALSHAAAVESDAKPASAHVTDRILCRKCGQANGSESERCSSCGHALWVFCQCGARNARSSENCPSCGDRLRTRRIPLGHPILRASSLSSCGPICSRSGPNDLGAALAIFALVGLIFAVVFLYPVLRDYEENQKANLQEAYQLEQSRQERQTAMRIEQERQADERQRQNDPMEEWIHRR